MPVQAGGSENHRFLLGMVKGLANRGYRDDRRAHQNPGPLLRREFPVGSCQVGILTYGLLYMTYMGIMRGEIPGRYPYITPPIYDLHGETG